MRMSPAWLVMAYLSLPMLPAPAGAHGPNDPPHQTLCMGDLKLESGDAIKDFCISYVAQAGATVPENELQNREISALLDIVTAHGKGIQ